MLLRICIVCSICFAVAVVALPQSSSKSRHRVSKPAVKPQPKEEPTPPAAPEPSTEPTTQPPPAENQPEEQQSVESLKVDTDLVTIPVIASTRDGNYIPDLRQEEFSVAEDGQAQQIAFFATVSAPFHVVLLLDTSASTEE